FEAAGDVTSIKNRLHPIDVGFDLRTLGMSAEVHCTDGEDMRASYADEDGNRRVVQGPRREVIARLREVGYDVQPVIHYRLSDGIYGYDEGDILVDETGCRSRAVRTGAGIQLEA